DIVSQGMVSNGWLQMPPHEGIRAGRYELPLTHRLEIDGCQDKELLNFTIIMLGFLLGLRLLPEGSGHLHTTALDTGKCNGFTLTDREILPCLALASEFFQLHHQSRNVKRMSSAVALLHW